MKLAAKIIAALLAGVFVCVILAEYVMLQHERAQQERNARQDCQQLCGTIAQIVEELWTAGGQARAMQALRKINELDRPFIARLVHYDASPNDPTYPMVPVSELLPRQDIAVFTQADRTRNCEVILAYTRLETGPRPTALELRYTPHDDQSNSRFVLYHAIALMGSTALLGAVLVLAIGAVWIGRPLQQLIERTRQIGKGDLASTLELNRRDEFGELAEAINKMCAQLRAAQQRIDQEVAARIAATDQLRHADRLRTVGRLAAGIAHEMGTPLNVISGRAGMIQSGRLDDTGIQQCAEVIKSESDRISTVIRQLLDFARRSTPQCQPVDITQLIRQSVELLASLAARSGVELRTPSVPGPCVLPIDSGQIQQVLTNLVVNAIEAIPDGGEVSIDLACPAATAPTDAETPTKRFARIDIRDTGQGIAPEIQEHIFEPFFTTKQTGQGTGLGLSIAYGIVREHGGRIEVSSRPGHGSCFSVYLPLENSSCRAAS